MISRFYLLAVFLSFLDVCILYPSMAMHRLPNDESDRLKLRLKLSKYVKEPEELAALAKEYCDQGKFKSAMKLFKIAIKKCPGNGRSYKMRGDCYRRMQNPESLVLAIADYREAVQRALQKTEFRILLADALYDNGELDEAIKETILSGLGSPALLNLGDKLKDAGKYDYALTCYSEALDRAPEPKEAVYYKRRAHCNQEMGFLTEAAKDLKIAMKGAPQDKEIQWNLTLTLLGLDEKTEALQVAFGMETAELTQLADHLYYGLQFDEAIRCYSKLIITNTDDAKSYERRGFCYWRKKELDSAIQDYEDALKLDSSCTSCRLALIDIYTDQGKYVDAEAMIEKLDTNKLSPPDADRVQKAENRIMDMRVLKVRKSLKKMATSTSKLSPERSSLSSGTSDDNANVDKIYPSIRKYELNRKRR